MKAISKLSIIALVALVTACSSTTPSKSTYISIAAETFIATLISLQKSGKISADVAFEATTVSFEYGNAICSILESDISPEEKRTMMTIDLTPQREKFDLAIGNLLDEVGAVEKMAISRALTIVRSAARVAITESVDPQVVSKPCTVIDALEDHWIRWYYA